MELDQIYRAEASYIANLLRRRGTPECEVEDVVHEVFIVLLRRALELEDGVDVRRWLGAVAVLLNRNRARSLRRRRPETARTTTRLDPDALADGTLARIDDTVVASQDAVRLARAMASLDRDKRDVLLMTVWEDRTAADIAALRQLSPNTVSSRLRAARRMLRRELDARLDG
jgi:RNA polymerase sigma-70 factor, ECF subfamily